MAETALEQPGDLSDSISFQFGRLRKAVARAPNECISRVPVLRKVFLIEMFNKVVLIMRLPEFVHAHTEAVLRVQNYAVRAGAEYITAEMWQSLRAVEKDLQQLYWQTLRYHKGLYPIGCQYMFSSFDLHFTERLLRHLGDTGPVEATDLHHCIDTVAHKQRFLKDQMVWSLLKTDAQVPAARPSSSLPPQSCTQASAAAACRSMPQHLFFGAAHGGFEACRSIHFFAFMCLSALLFSLSDDHALLAVLSERSV